MLKQLRFSTSTIVTFRRKNHVLITWEPGLASLELHASFIIHNRQLPLEELIQWLRPLPPQLFLHQVFHMLVGFLHGQCRECHIYLDRPFNLMCLLFCLLHKALCLRWAGATTWLVKNCWMSCLYLRLLCFWMLTHIYWLTWYGLKAIRYIS